MTIDCQYFIFIARHLSLASLLPRSFPISLSKAEPKRKLRVRWQSVTQKKISQYQTTAKDDEMSVFMMPLNTKLSLIDATLEHKSESKAQ